MKQTKIKEEAYQNPSYDRSLAPEMRLYDFLGKYYINLNGVVPNNHPEITEPHKKEIVDFVLEIIQQTRKQDMEWILKQIKVNEGSSRPKSDLIKQINRRLFTLAQEL